MDCAHENEASGLRKVGMVTGSAFAYESEMPYNIPLEFKYHTMRSQASSGGLMTISNVMFKDFHSRVCETTTGPKPAAINLHESSSDLIM